MTQHIKHYVTFFREFRRTFHTTGAILPSGQQLAKSTLKPFLSRAKPSRILEVGPGTGALTQEIVRHLGKGDVFDIVELNDRFVELLRRRFATEPAFQQSAGTSTVHHLPIQEFVAEEPYDFIMCGLPFNNLPPRIVKDIFKHFTQLLAPGGVLSFFEYLWIRRMSSLLSSKPERIRLAHVGCILSWYLERYAFHHDTAYVNFPPAVVHHLRIDLSAQTSPTNDIVAA
jgi:phospholipid N-methyltransferase